MTRELSPILLGLVLLGACDDEPASVKPEPVSMTAEALGYYCQMNILEHDGPVAQIHRAGFEQPIWFSQVRDAIAYTRLPEETETMTAYIVRMAKGDLPTGSLAYQSIFAVGLLLFLMTLAMNLVSYRLSRKLRARNRV